ncbi:methyl-accepting chemotaxis protein [Paenibacillus sp. D2_2]|uniref:methyl-accepting chemotaxis protein n=1 Tax=Paenibacillus sp. D2_2 TaxID=3073092 RepID=UPI002814BCF0|nr:methyl-accepting chemotaxis protein [Paenibacillus sp. D2_2]WMT40646.1 methyl-accepting chemotaxis protein [Paenibacillus sp. D2_2]
MKRQSGEEGRGFAVVAGEVRKLAEQSKLTVEKIQQSLTMMAELTERAYAKMSQDVVTNVELGMTVTGMRRRRSNKSSSRPSRLSSRFRMYRPLQNKCRPARIR